MSIITEAMKKAALQRSGSPSGPGLRRTAATRSRSAPVHPAEALASARPFQAVAVDAAVMASNKLLPTLTDRAARRAYKILRTKLLQKLNADSCRSLMVTGTSSGVGKTLTAANLALALAQDPNTWVFLVDLDLQRPNIANVLGLRPDRGLTDYLVGDATLDDVIYQPAGLDRLAVVPNGRAVEQSSELLSSSRMHEFVQGIEAEAPSRIIVYDVPPLLVSDDVLAVAPLVDSVLLVATEGLTPRSTLEQAREILSEMNLLGVVLNRSSERDDSPYY
jgi:capsular exopolysaccharide synthesis family protein